MPQFGAQIDALRIPIKGLIPEQSATALATPAEGLLWHDTVNKHIFAWLNGTWVQVDNAAGGSTPSGPAGGDLTGTYPNPTIGAGKVDSSKILDGTIALTDLAAALIEAGIGAGTAPSGSPALRVLGFAAGDSMAGNATLDVQATSNPLTGPLSLNSKRITGLADPTSAQDGATKNYVDSVAQGLDTKMSCKCATTASINAGGTPSGAATLDGIAVTTGDRVLVKDQSNPNNNGIYVANTGGAWTRATDMDTWAEVPGAFTFVEEGLTQNDTGWVCVSNQGGTIGTNGITWAQFSGAGSVIAGLGLTRTANTIDVIAGDTSLVVNSDEMHVNTSVIATVASLSAYAPLASPTFTGDPKAPTPTAGDNDTSIATTAFVTGAIATSAAGALKKYTGSVTLNTPGTWTTVTGIPGTLGVPPVSVEFVRGSGGQTTPIELDWQVRSTQEDFQVKADVAVGLVTVYAVA